MLMAKALTTIHPSAVYEEDEDDLQDDGFVEVSLAEEQTEEDPSKESEPVFARYWKCNTHKGTKRLHKINGCYLSRGRKVGEWHLLEDVKTCDYNAICTYCGMWSNY